MMRAFSLTCSLFILGAGYYPDPDNCRKYWHCVKGGGSEHILCPDADDGTPEMYSTTYNGCDFKENVKCDGRPICDECNNNCDATPTVAPDCTPEDQKIDCAELGAGWHPDAFNCRRYWHCLKENSEPEHLLCDLDEHGEFMVWDLTYDGCNYLEQTTCGERPICDECNEGCWDITTDHPTEAIDCGHDLGTQSKFHKNYKTKMFSKKVLGPKKYISQKIRCSPLTVATT